MSEEVTLGILVHLRMKMVKSYWFGVVIVLIDGLGQSAVTEADRIDRFQPYHAKTFEVNLVAVLVAIDGGR